MGSSSLRLKAVVVLPAEALREKAAVPPVRSGCASAPLSTPQVAASTEQPLNSLNSLYGIPVSAVQNCCGRGCKHCRVFWHRTKP